MGSFSIDEDATAAGVGRMDQRLLKILRYAAEQSPFDVVITSGWRDNSDNHRHGAIDMYLVDPQTGEVLPNYQSSPHFRVYEDFARLARKIQQDYFPELSDDLRWGGYFSGPIPETYGAMDLMHFDMMGAKGMAAGNFLDGLSDEWATRWGVPRRTSLPRPRPEHSTVPFADEDRKRQAAFLLARRSEQQDSSGHSFGVPSHAVFDPAPAWGTTPLRPPPSEALFNPPVPKGGPPSSMRPIAGRFGAGPVPTRQRFEPITALRPRRRLARESAGLTQSIEQLSPQNGGSPYRGLLSEFLAGLARPRRT